MKVLITLHRLENPYNTPPPIAITGNWLTQWKLPDFRWAPQQQQKKEERPWEVGRGRVERVVKCMRGCWWRWQCQKRDRSRSRGVATLDEAPRISLRMSSKSLTLAPLSLLLAITALARTLACLSMTVAFAQTTASSLTPSKPEKERRAEGFEEALWYNAWLCVGR